MRFRTFAGVLVAIGAAIAVAYLSNLNTQLLIERFSVTRTVSVPVYSALIGVFLLGFLPTVGILLVQRLRRDLVERRLRRRSREERSLESRFRRAVDFAVDGQWRRSVDEIESVLTEKPEDFASMLLYGEALRRAGRAEDALEVHRKASVLYPRSSSLLYGLTAAYEALDEPTVAEQVRDRIVRDIAGHGLAVLRHQRRQALEARDWRESERLQERINGLIDERELSGAEAEEERAVRLGLTYQSAVDDLQNDRFREATRAVEALIAEEALFVPALILRGEIERLRGQDHEAVACWRQGFVASGSPVLLQRIEDHFIEREQPLEALDQLHGIIQESDNDLLPRFFLGRLFYRLEMHDEALKALKDLAEDIRVSPTYHLLLAQIHNRRGDLREALDNFLLSVRQAGMTEAGFICRVCSERSPDWRACCPSCSSWNAVDLDLTLEGFSPEDLGVRSGTALVPFGRIS